MQFVWLILFLLFIWFEATTISLVSIWFAVGALVAEIVCLFGGAIWLQALLFFVVSCALLAALRPITRKFITPKLSKTNVDAVVGTTGKVTIRIDNDGAQGQVKLAGMEWTARSSTDSVIEVGTLIRVDKIEGVKVFVSPVEVLEQI